jgi:peroxiredoxin Q/BCP
MKSIAVGDRAPDFSQSDQNSQQLSLADFRGKKTVVLFFYPADESPICIKEVCAFRDAYQDFTDAGAVVIGISSDSLDSHQKFAANHRLPFHLLSDSDGNLRKAFGTPKLLGVLPGRVTYVIDPDGVVRHLFSAQLAADRHVQEALKTVSEIAARKE